MQALQRQDDFQDAPSHFANPTDALSSVSTSDVLPVALDSIGSASPAAHTPATQGMSAQLDAGGATSRAAEAVPIGAVPGGRANGVQPVLHGSGSSPGVPQGGIRSWWGARNQEGYAVVSASSDSPAAQHHASGRHTVGTAAAHMPTDHSRNQAGRNGVLYPEVPQTGSVNEERRRPASDDMVSGDELV